VGGWVWVVLVVRGGDEQCHFQQPTYVYSRLNFYYLNRKLGGDLYRLAVHCVAQNVVLDDEADF
jgi:hypothetical protein